MMFSWAGLSLVQSLTSFVFYVSSFLSRYFLAETNTTIKPIKPVATGPKKLSPILVMPIR